MRVIPCIFRRTFSFPRVSPVLRAWSADASPSAAFPPPDFVYDLDPPDPCVALILPWKRWLLPLAPGRCAILQPISVNPFPLNPGNSLPHSKPYGAARASLPVSHLDVVKNKRPTHATLWSMKQTGIGIKRRRSGRTDERELLLFHASAAIDLCFVEIAPIAVDVQRIR